MDLELHVWGSAFGLDSVDPECLAAIAYLNLAMQGSAWKLVYTSPSGLPTYRLPALFCPTAKTWTAGLPAIISYLQTHDPAQFHDSDAALSSSVLADAAACAAYLRSVAAPLLGLSLYASGANWVGATRPAYSAALPFPLGWTDAPRARDAWIRAAEPHMNLLPDDYDDADGSATSMRGARAERGDDGWIKIPRAGSSGSDIVQHARRAAISARLDAVIKDVMDVLAAQLRNSSDGSDSDVRSSWFLGAKSPSSLDCLAYGYLSLMLVTDLPRPWLYDAVTRHEHYSALRSFVDNARTTLFAEPLPCMPVRSSSSLTIGLNFARGALRAIPGVGDEWARWCASRNLRDNTRPDLLVAAGAMVAIAAMVAGVVFRQRLPALGLPVQRWEQERTGLWMFGAAGGLFGFTSNGAAQNDDGAVNGSRTALDDERGPIMEVDVEVDS